VAAGKQARRSAAAKRPREGGVEGPQLAAALARGLDEVKAEGVRVLDVRGLTDVTDFLVIATALSERQLAALAAAAETVIASSGRTHLGTEGTGASGWMVVDTGEVVTHLLTREARTYYDLDGLWADAKVLETPT
jgi:ribosome-associated protein